MTTLFEHNCCGFLFIKSFKFSIMADKNRNDNRASGRSEKEDKNISENKKTQNVSNQRDQNPQKGSKWSNYQTRELSDEDYSDENIPGGQSA